MEELRDVSSEQLEHFLDDARDLHGKFGNPGKPTQIPNGLLKSSIFLKPCILSTLRRWFKFLKMKLSEGKARWLIKCKAD